MHKYLLNVMRFMAWPSYLFCSEPLGSTSIFFGSVWMQCKVERIYWNGNYWSKSDSTLVFSGCWTRTSSTYVSGQCHKQVREKARDAYMVAIKQRGGGDSQPFSHTLVLVGWSKGSSKMEKLWQEWNEHVQQIQEQWGHLRTELNFGGQPSERTPTQHLQTKIHWRKVRFKDEIQATTTEMRRS